MQKRSLKDVMIKSADGTAIYGYLKKPTGEGPFNAVIFIHGGMGDSREYTQALLEWSLAKLLAKEGFFLLSTDYRVDYEGKDISDIIAAFEFAAKLPYVDENRIAYFGDSHGSFLAMMAATRTDPCAIVHGWGVTDMAGWYEHIKKMPVPVYQRIAEDL